MKLSDYQALIAGAVCPACKSVLPAVLKTYDHSGGYTVEGFTSRQWLYVECLHCQFQVSLWKIGMAHPFANTEAPK